MNANRIYVVLLWMQGIYILLTALWGLADIISFMQVTGPKTDIWLVKTVSVLLIPIAISFFFNIHSPRYPLQTIVLGTTTSAGLAFIDFYYTANKTIKWVYAVDGSIELVFFFIWIYLLASAKKIKS